LFYLFNIFNELLAIAGSILLSAIFSGLPLAKRFPF